MSPIVRSIRVPTSPASAIAITRMSTAATRFGRYATISPDNVSSTAIPSCDTAIASALMNRNQNVIAPITGLGLTPTR